MLGFEPIPSASEPWCPTHSAIGTFAISEKCKLNHWKIRHEGDSKSGPQLEKILSGTYC